MTGELVRILDPKTGAVVGRCNGPTATGCCPRADSNGIVACAGRVIAPQNADPKYWPVRVPANLWQCPLGWSRQAQIWLGRAEAVRALRQAGQRNEIAYAKMRAEAGDKRFTTMTRSALEMIGRARWSESPYAKRLAALEGTCRRRAQVYQDVAASHPYQLPERARRVAKVTG